MRRMPRRPPPHAPRAPRTWHCIRAHGVKRALDERPLCAGPHLHLQGAGGQLHGRAGGGGGLAAGALCGAREGG